MGMSASCGHWRLVPTAWILSETVFDPTKDPCRRNWMIESCSMRKGPTSGLILLAWRKFDHLLPTMTLPEDRCLQLVEAEGPPLHSNAAATGQGSSSTCARQTASETGRGLRTSITMWLGSYFHCPGSYVTMALPRSRLTVMRRLCRAHKRTVSAPDFPSLQQRSHHYPSFGPLAEPTPPKSPQAEEQQSVGSDTAMPATPIENAHASPGIPQRA